MPQHVSDVGEHPRVVEMSVCSAVVGVVFHKHHTISQSKMADSSGHNVRGFPDEVEGPADCKGDANPAALLYLLDPSF
jgi:hypothetical protein